ncbi:MAG TPA: carboxypeptidase-like regulatory domain-containing protein [Vicinamibacterales bacterium]|nr:carboxypeptidase-like regulatory domain-containing protein [Vicinamibacterales bacterium]
MQVLNWMFRAMPAAALCALALGTVTFAQPQTSSELHGTVTDQTGGVILGASVTLADGRGQKWTTVTNDRGGYVFERVPPGRYTLTVRREGFLEFRARVDVRPETATAVDARLTVGISVSAEVHAKEQPGLSMDPRKNLSALLLTEKEIAALPDDPQRLMRRILEMAGSTGRPNDVALFVDGFREYRRFPPKSTIEMIRINSNPFSAEFAQPSLDRVEIMTKPGSDTFHGEATLQAGDSALDARNPLSATKPETRIWNYHGFLQGPIDRGRLDFLAYAGQWQQDDTAVLHATVPDPATGSAQPLATAVSAPIRIRSLMLGTNFRVSNQRFNVSYTRNDETRRNQGLESGFSLPEHAYDGSSTDEVARLWWTSLGEHRVNDVRFELTRAFAEASPRMATPAVLVLDAFNAGGNQDVASRASTVGMQGSETLTIQQGRHTIKTGVRIENRKYDSTDRSGFGGTFVFGADVERDALGNPVLNGAGQTTLVSPLENYRRTVLGRQGYAPSEFWIVRGTPDVGVEQWDFGSFVLDDWSLSNRVSLSYGVRQDGQSNVEPRLYLAPRASLSWLLDANAKNAIKLGAGIFTGRVEPAITLDANKVNGVDRQQLIIERPSGFPAIPNSGDLLTVPSAIHTKAPDLRLPYSIIALVSYERQLPGGLFALGQYSYTKGLDLLRLRNIADPGGTAAAPVLRFESTGRSSQRELMAGLRGNTSRNFTLYANYIYGTKHSDTDDAFTTPANSRDLSSEYGLAADDRRHQFVSGATVEWKRGLSISPYVAILSGLPFNITTGRDTDGDTLFSDRPAFAAAGDPGAIETRFGWLNPNPQPGDRIIPRNLGREPWTFTLNLSVTQSVVQGVSVTVDAENLMNRARYIRSDGVLTSPTFGLPNQALSGRRLLVIITGGF